MSAGLNFSRDWQKWEKVKGVGKKTADKLRQKYPTPLSFIEATKNRRFYIDVKDILRLDLKITKPKLLDHVMKFWECAKTVVNYFDDSKRRKMNIRHWYGLHSDPIADADIVYFDKFYKGELFRGKPNGKGKMTTFIPDANHHHETYIGIYEGDWVRGRKEGQGEMKYTNGVGVYKGDWVNDKREGHGVMHHYQGSLYVGEYVGHWVGDKKKGQGKMTFNDTITWDMGKINLSRTEQSNIFGKIKSYEGNWEGEKREGYGKSIYDNGIIYEGHYVNDDREGEGKMTWSSVSTSLFTGFRTYEGNYVKGKREGHGKMTFGDGYIWEGEWLGSEQKSGKVKIKYRDGDVYEGDWVYVGIGLGVVAGGPPKETWGHRHGYGKMTYANGGFYEGEWVDNNRSGFGVLRLANPVVIYKGNWEDDKRNGSGMIEYPKNNSYFEGTFENDKGTGTYVTESLGRTFVRYGFVDAGSFDFNDSEEIKNYFTGAADVYKIKY